MFFGGKMKRRKRKSGNVKEKVIKGKEKGNLKLKG
jgi:hypothetical protein